MYPKQSTDRGHVLIVDDIRENRRLLEQVLRSDGHAVTAAEDGATALTLVEDAAPDVVLSDIHMPRMNGVQLCRHLKSGTSTRLLPVVLITGRNDQDARLAGIDAGADEFIQKPFNVQELSARMRALIRLKHFTDELESAEAVILYLAATVEARDPYTGGHCQRLAAYAVALGRQLGLRADELVALRKGGHLHDVGKIAVPDALLSKSSPLEPAEYEAIKQHVITGERLCNGLRSLALVRPIVRSHHERFDGSGYPDRLLGDSIPLLAQIMSIADVFDALTTDRPYRKAWSVEQACQELQREATIGRLNPRLVETFLSLPLTRLRDELA